MSDYRFSFVKHGDLPKVLCLFHGFGQDKSIFNSWFDKLEQRYTIYAIDLFYHGDSTRPYRPLTKSEWKEYFQQFLSSNGINQFSVLGFSLGGRFAIATAIEFQHRVEHLFLVAPDAIYKTPWFRLATTPLLKSLFKYYMLNPDKLDRLIKRSVKWGIVSRYMADFVNRELGENDNRKRVYVSWNHFKPLGYTHKQLRKYFGESTFDKTLIIGSKDIVIPPKKILPLLKNCGFEVIILDKKHHQLVKADLVEHILNVQK